MTKAEKAHMARVAQLPCIVCGRQPVELHHPRKGAGLGRRASHFDVIPLCPENHRLGGYGTAIHAGQRAFEKKFGTEEQLLAKTREALGMEMA